MDYAPDEFSQPTDPDPLAERFDLGNDPIQYARRQWTLIAELWPDLVQRMVPEGDGYQDARKAFNVLLFERGRTALHVARLIGGLSMYPDHRGDPNARPPFVPVEAQRQREALKLLAEEVFSPDAYQFPSELYNQLAPNFWMHWGTRSDEGPDYPLHEVILNWQDRILAQLLSAPRLQRLLDSEIRVPADQDAFTAAELLAGLTQAVFREIHQPPEGKFSVRQPAVRSLRRNLQRRYLECLANLALGVTAPLGDCRTVALEELQSLEGQLKQVLDAKVELDTYSRAHLKDCLRRIRNVLDAQLTLRAP